MQEHYATAATGRSGHRTAILVLPCNKSHCRRCTAFKTQTTLQQGNEVHGMYTKHDKQILHHTWWGPTMLALNSLNIVFPQGEESNNTRLEIHESRKAL